MRNPILFGVVAALVASSALAIPALADTTREPLIIDNNSSANALSIIQSSDVGRSRSRSGALFVDNTGNDNTGLTVYTDAGSSAAQPLMRLDVTNEDWNQEVLRIHSDSPTSRGLIRLDSPAPEIEFVETDQPGAKGKFEIRVQHDRFQFNSRRAGDKTFENKISMTHDGDLEFRDGTVRVESDKPAEFAGGINITGGCLAIDGECVTAGELSSADTSDTSRSSRPEPREFGKTELSEGKPPSIDCNSYTERGRMSLDHENNRLYVCNGPDRGWDYTTLSN